VIGRLNLATRPARNERLTALLVGLAALLVLLGTVEHGFVLRRLLSSQVEGQNATASTLETELAGLRAEASALREVRTDPASAKQWALLKDLVDRRAFSWTGLLARLEAVLPADVRLASISPATSHGQVKLELEAVTRSPERGVAFVKALADRPDFDQVFLQSLTAGEGGFVCRYTMDYKPRTTGLPARSTDAADSSQEADP
jgi:Tfp pilus assembly protein PilN